MHQVMIRPKTSFWDVDAQYVDILDRIIEAVESGVEPDDSVLRLFDEVFAARQDKTDGVVHFLRAIESRIAFLRSEEAFDRQRRESAEKALVKFKEYLKSTLEAHGVQNAEGRKEKLWIQTNSQEALIIDDESLLDLATLPADHPLRQYVVTHVSYRLNKPAIANAIKNGTVIEGVRLERGSHLRFSKPRRPDVLPDGTDVERDALPPSGS